MFPLCLKVDAQPSCSSDACARLCSVRYVGVWNGLPDDVVQLIDIPN